MTFIKKGSPLRAPGGMRLAGGAGFGGEEKGWAGGIWRLAGVSKAKVGRREGEISVWRRCSGRYFEEEGILVNSSGMALGLTKQDRINTVYGGGRHVVILGAGASIAATRRNPELHGKALPSMDNFIEVVGLQDVVQSLPFELQHGNFELLYSELHQADPRSATILEIQARVQHYFSNMQMPDEPTIYDYLVWSLRPKDLIATFNWDPFLVQAYRRHPDKNLLPNCAFLHGNVAMGYSEEDGRSGPAGGRHRLTGNYYFPTPLLFPVTQKNYNDHPFIRGEWERVKAWLHSKDTKLVTIFGYGAPTTDVEAMRLLNDAWGTPDQRDMEQFEVIDIKPEDEITRTWEGFIHTHHYDYGSDYFESSLAHNPRRTAESYFQHIEPMSIEEAFSESNPVPADLKTWKEFYEWYEPLILAERMAEKATDRTKGNL